jgi:exodeoxyribonuclease VII small subunit
LVKTPENLSFEGAMTRLEEIVKQLEQGELSLDEALGCFQEGVGLVRLCNNQLRSVEGQVEILMQQLEGESGEEGNTDEMD